jgi:hypothetical protein
MTGRLAAKLSWLTMDWRGARALATDGGARLRHGCEFTGRAA